MSNSSSNWQISTSIQPISERDSDLVPEKEEFYQNFLNYREILDISIQGYSIKKIRFKEYAVYFKYNSY